MLQLDGRWTDCAVTLGRRLRRTTLVDALAVWLGGKAAASKSERYELLYALPWAEVTTNNFGFAPAPGDHPERFQLQMYAELRERLRAAGGTTGPRLLEIGCGRGGGLRHLVDLSDDDLFAVGLDLSSHAIRFCQAQHGRVPWYWRILLGRRLAQYAALPGSPKFEAFRTRERAYFMGCLRRAA